jgi:hypothetical protein
MAPTLDADILITDPDSNRSTRNLSQPYARQWSLISNQNTSTVMQKPTRLVSPRSPATVPSHPSLTFWRRLAK